ncbi:MAG: zinc-dependent peptidase [Cytophagaceae bacterium]
MPIEDILFVIFFTVGILGVLIILKQFFKIAISDGNKPFRFISGPLPVKYKIPLERHFKYFEGLSPDQKKEFERRLNNFIHNKEFVPMHGLELTDEMVALISASAIQLTMGLPEIYFVHFRKILVFPAEYLNRKTMNRHLGEVDENGVIAFSWKHFVDGYINPEDTYNLGLHEMAHALSLENGIQNQEYRFLDEKKLNHWKFLADVEFLKIKNGATTFLRKYAVSSREEFFPVCVEYFFERPEQFKKEAPHLYNALADLLNQHLDNGTIQEELPLVENV